MEFVVEGKRAAGTSGGGVDGGVAGECGREGPGVRGIGGMVEERDCRWHDDENCIQVGVGVRV